MHGDLINKLNYFPVGLGDKKFDSYFLSDKNGNQYRIKILIMENILFIIGFGKIIIILPVIRGLVFANTVNFGLKKNLSYLQTKLKILKKTY